MDEKQITVATTRNPTSLWDHQYYGPLIESYIRSILKSGLLLDEDLEVLLSVSKFRNIPERKGYKPSLSLLACVISTLGSSYLARTINRPLLVLPPVIASIYFSVLEYKNEKMKQRHKRLIEILLEVLRKYQKLNKNIIRYMKTRSDLGKTKDQNSAILYSKNVEEFMEIFLQNTCNILEYLCEHLKKVIDYYPALQEDFLMLEHLDYSNILRGDNLNDIDNCLMYTQKVHDLNVLIFSKLLSYIGMLFSAQDLQEVVGRTLINETLPNITKILQQHCDKTKKQFFNLRHSVIKKSEIQLQSGTEKRKFILTKLEATLISSVNNLSIILEKSQSILDKLELDREMDVPAQIGDAIVDLRNHTFATYESLDLLCRLYGILSNSNIRKPTIVTLKDTSKGNSDPLEILPMVNYDDDSEPIEEKYEIYIGAEDSVEEHKDRAVYEDQSSAYLSLMLQELKQSLRKHERFIEAKNKRGEDDGEIEIEKKISREHKPSMPKFDLNELKESPNQNPVKEKQKIEDVPKEIVTNMPPPLPPPLPLFDLNDLEQESGQTNARSMLENIKVLSNQRDVQEEVFGDSDKDSDYSD